MKMPCNNCSACLMNDCGGCKFCLDKRKFGGPGKLKKRCEMRQCVIPKKVGGGSTTTKATTIATSSTTFVQKQPEIRNKFLASVEIEDSDMNSSFEDSFSIKTIGDESPTLAADQKASLDPSGVNDTGCTFEDPSELLQYVRKDQTDQKFHCTLCDKFSHKYSSCTRNHVESKHFPNTFSYPCDQCEMVFSTKSNFSMHRSRKHNPNRMSIIDVNN